MKMKVKKVRNIEKDICCSEQVVAYNFARVWAWDFKKDLSEARTEIELSENLFKYERESKFYDEYGIPLKEIEQYVKSLDINNRFNYIYLSYVLFQE